MTVVEVSAFRWGYDLEEGDGIKVVYENQRLVGSTWVWNDDGRGWRQWWTDRADNGELVVHAPPETRH